MLMYLVRFQSMGEPKEGSDSGESNGGSRKLWPCCGRFAGKRRRRIMLASAQNGRSGVKRLVGNAIRQGRGQFPQNRIFFRSD